MLFEFDKSPGPQNTEKQKQWKTFVHKEKLYFG